MMIVKKEQLQEKFGPWAIVTGASSGIGEQFAQTLAAAGLNVVLVARRQELLGPLAKTLETEHGIDVLPVQLDLSQPDFMDHLLKATSHLEIGLVVSNAGFASMGAVLTIPLEQLEQNLALNASAHLKLAHHFGAEFVANDRGGLLFVGSTVGLQATPYAANYAGAKAYVHGLGQAMNFELRSTGVHVTSLAPGPTKTEAISTKTDFDLDRLPAPLMEPSRLVDIGLRGLLKNKPLVVAGVPNRMVDWMNRKIFGHRGSRRMLGLMMERVAPANRTIAR